MCLGHILQQILCWDHCLREEYIPILARIFAVPDSFDAQTSDRPYKQVHSPKLALENIRADSRALYDPRIVDEFSAMISESKSPQDSNRGFGDPSPRGPALSGDD